jgi:hypothetical protein
MAVSPRDIPSGTAFSVPHHECLKAAKRFLDQLKKADARLAEEGLDPILVELARHSRGLDSLSQAVQIFAGMAAEAALNLYGVLALGEEEFYKKIDRRYFPDKLSAIMALGRDRPVAPDSELVELGERVSQARNAFVHPKPREIPMDNQQRGRSGRVDLERAEQAVADAQRFIFLLATRDRDYYPYLAVF